MRHRGRPDGAAPMALDLGPDAVRLMRADGAGGWHELGEAPLDAGFARWIAALRDIALEHDAEADAGAGARVDLWLPPGQILARRYDVAHAGAHGARHEARREAEARRRVAAETGGRAADVSVAVAPVRPGEPMRVLAVPARTVAEARAYAGRWGFRPARVSVAPDHRDGFGEAGPSFAPPGRILPAAPSLGQVTGALAALLVAGAGAWATWALIADPPRPAFAMIAPAIGAAPADGASAPTSENAVDAAGPEQRDAAAPPPAIAKPPAPRTTGPAPARASSTRADRAKGVGRGDEVAALIRSLPERREAAATPSAPLVLAAATLAPRAVQGAPAPRPPLAPHAAAPGTKPDARPAEASATEAAPASDSALAVPAAPLPPVRPADRAADFARALHGATGGEPSPAGVRQAAARHGLEIDGLGLIGVLEADSGRRALLRTAAGDVVTLAEGDSVLGWRVDAIGHDSVRVTRGGESRTLPVSLR